MAGALKFRTKWYFNTPQMLARLGKWKHDILARTGAYARGVFRNQLGRPQLKQKAQRTVQVYVPVRAKNGGTYVYSGVLYVPRRGEIIDLTTGKPAPLEAAQFALKVVSARLKGQGKGKPPRKGVGILRAGTDFALDPLAETVVAGTVPIDQLKGNILAASTGQLLNEGRGGFIQHPVMPAPVFTTWAFHPYVEPSLPPTVKKLKQLIQRRPAGTR